MASEQNVSINVKSDVMLDETLDISVTGLPAESKVTLRLYLKTAESTAEFDSYGQYIADCNGRIRLNEDPSLGGTYCGKYVHMLITSSSSNNDNNNKNKNNSNKTLL